MRHMLWILQDVSSLLSIIAAIIHIGDIRFTEDETVLHISDKSMVINHQLLHVGMCADNYW